jgi:hypothetical protein
MPVGNKEQHHTDRIGWLRAAVLGANDGILSTSSLVLGVATSQVADRKRAKVLTEHLGKYSLAALTPEVTAKFRDARLAGEDRQDEFGDPRPRTNNTVRLCPESFVSFANGSNVNLFTPETKPCPHLREEDHRPPAIHSFVVRSLRALPITETELKLMAAAAIIGFKSSPKAGNSTPAASGMPTTL